MRPVRVVMAAPGFNLAPRIEEIAEPAYLQALFTQTAVEALDVRVLHRLARTDVYQFDPLIQTPGDEAAASELRAVVCSNTLRCSTLVDDLFQHANHTDAAQRSVRLQRQALACEHIDHAQDPQVAMARQRVGGKV